MIDKLLRIVNGGGHLLHLFIYYIPNKIRYKNWHLRSQIIKPFRVTQRYISIGDRVTILRDARIEGISQYNDIRYTPNIIIEDGVTIQQELHLTCANNIQIGRNTAIAAHVTITDINHPYTDVNIPIEHQNLEVKSVTIGRDCKIYNGAVILPGVTIGNHVTIGANSVVNINIPDYCVAVGLPAKIIKRYDHISGQWIQV